MKVKGGCHCGQITYEAEVDPNQAGICHCTDCQLLSGSAFRTVIVTIDDKFKLLSGELKEYVKKGENGNERVQTFCPNCGSPIYSAPPVSEGRENYVIRLGTINERDQLTPKFQVWCRSSQPWISNMDDMVAINTQPGEPE